MPGPFSLLVKKRGLLKAAISRSSEISKDLSSCSIDYIKIRLVKLDANYDEFLKISNQMLEFCGKEEYVDPTPDIEEYENKYFDTQAAFAHELRIRTQSETPVPESVPNETIERLAAQQETFLERLNHAEAQAPLAKVTVPTFSGNYEDWPSFRDLFNSAVHNQLSLSNVQRFHYLKSFLTGDALQLIKHLAITDDNYQSAWERLTNRYDRKQLIVKSFILTFLSLPAVHNPNAAALRKLSDTADEVIRGLDALNVTQRDAWIIQLLLNKVDEDTKRAWAELGDGQREESLTNFLHFLSHRCDVLEALPSSRSTRKVAVTNHASPQMKAVSTPCPCCTGQHRISLCPKFMALNVADRRTIVNKQRLCFNCLSKTHTVSKCKSTFKCKKCNASHHTLVHMDAATATATTFTSNSPLVTSDTENFNIQPVESNHSVQSKRGSTLSLLPTIVVMVQNSMGQLIPCRALLDSGSTTTFVTESVTQSMGCPRNHARIPVLGLSSCHAGVSRGRVDLKLFSRVSDDTLLINALVLPKLTSQLPSHPVTSSDSWSSFTSLPLADPDFSEPGPIDILIGADFLPAIYTGECRKPSTCFVSAMNTIFGWVLIGPCTDRKENPTIYFSVNHAMIDIDYLAHLFMDMESIQPQQTSSDIVDPVEADFANTHIRDPVGSYIVSYPMKDEYPPIKDTLLSTVNRLSQMERRFTRNLELHNEYKRSLKEYESLGHMEVIPPAKIFIPSVTPFYLPHHAVIKLASTTTKYRVVFDGSSKDSSGLSLNDRMLIGPPIQRDLFGVILRFRRHRLVFTADIEKMFRGIKLVRGQQDLQRIVWREDESQPIQHYRLKTVTYDNIVNRWNQYTDDLANLSNVRVSRYLGSNCVQFELHGFADASAVIYSRFCVGTTFKTCLIAAKTRVAPLKPVSIPRLELNAAVLLIRLLNRVIASLAISTIRFTCWTDSEIVLHWLSANPKRWQSFVCNRVSEILEFAPRPSRRHVRSEDNLADCASRGLLPHSLLMHQQWWHGPTWLTEDKEKWPHYTISPTFSNDEPCLEVRKAALITLAVHTEFNAVAQLITNTSNWSRVVRIMAYCLRFISVCRSKQSFPVYLTSDELVLGRYTLTRHVQHQFFADELRALQLGNQVSNKSPLRQLAPFLDDHQMIRVGGRLRHSTLLCNMKYPIILPKDSNLSLILEQHIHLVNLHSGVEATFVYLRQQYWILGSRRLIRKVIFNCKACFMQRRTQNPQLMGDLPAARAQAHRCFLHCGLDYAGPIFVKQSKGRNPKHSKAWFAIFICLSVKAIHIELVSDLTTDAFLAAFRRFVARRGKPTDLYSDNGTTFRGAARELQELHTSVLSETNVQLISELLANDGVQWHFNPPSAPHFGGLWEAGVRSTKLHLRRVLGSAVLTFEEYSTLLSQVEAILNSRPLCSISDDDLDPLTPAHFLLGAPYTAIPEPTLLNVNANRLKRWRLLQAMVQGFWFRWHNEYLTSLQQRPKWQKPAPILRKGDLVVLKEPNLPPAKWIMGRIIEAIPGKDGVVRVAKIRTARGEYKRPVVKLVPLPIS